MRLELGSYGAAVQRRIDALSSDDAAARIWRHDASFWGGDAERQKSVANRLGWLEVAQQMRAEARPLQSFAAQVRSEGFRDAVVLGMGGSSLAPEVLRQSFGPREGWPALHVLDTTDPATIRSVVERIDPAHTLFFVSSKSGTTIEALSLFAYFHSLVKAAKPGRTGENFVAITDARTPLQDLAKEHSFRRVFTNPGDIGGRYSALSYFGLVPAAVTGIDVAKLLTRGIAAAEATKLPQSEALSLGAVLGELALAGRDKATFVVAPKIGSFGLWVEQLIAESTGKLGRGILPVAGEPLGGPQHYGGDRLFVQLRLAGDGAADDDAAITALTAGGHPAAVIDLADAYDLGREFFQWEFAVAVAGHVLEINPFDEPNVQESKDNTKRVLEEFERTGTLDVTGIDERREPIALTSPDAIAEASLEDAVRSLIAAVAKHDYVAITAYIEPTQGAEAAFAAMRATIRDATGAATTLGYGPRFLHSTGQLHKGGPPTGVFLQVTASDSSDISVPGKPFTFAQLNRAQAIGDFQSLLAHGRPAVRIHLGTDVKQGLATLREAVRSAVASGSASRR
ncbi:MAG: glucose-6-phosphate isomerase [Chloroflexota bacterium]|nr:glucose-6-phosphate isomerase [Chloroflexota bacterium]